MEGGDEVIRIIFVVDVFGVVVGGSDGYVCADTLDHVLVVMTLDLELTWLLVWLVHIVMGALRKVLCCFWEESIFSLMVK